MDRILLTGAAGIVGTALRPFLRDAYPQVVLTDLAEIRDLEEGESFVQGDIADPEFVARVAQGVDGIVHLAGLVGPDYTFEEVLLPNIAGTCHVFEAARRTGVTHVVNASSHHAVGFLTREDHLDHTTAQRPDSFYGLSKAFGESASSYFADKHGLNILSIRIGFVGPEVIDERRLHTWISAGDLAQLVRIGLETKDLGHEIVYGTSDNPAPFFDNSNAFRLGYRPQDRSLDHLADEDLRNAVPDPEKPEGRYIGGPFC